MTYLYLLLGISFAISALGWVYFIYFFSIGYGFAISALSVAAAVMFRDGTAIVCGAVRLWHKVGTLLAIEREALGIV